MRLYLVDGTFELFRAYYADRRNHSADGMAASPTGAVRGLVASLLALLRHEPVDLIAVAFDHVIESFRNDLFAGYKSSAGVPEDLLQQFEEAEDAVRSLGIVVWPMIEFEADDALATAAVRWRDHPDLEQIVICSPDKDLAQVVHGDKVVARNRMRDTTLDEAGVQAKFGVAPASIPDYLALVGDSADGIPGVPGWGSKSTAATLSFYPTVDEIPRDAAQWGVAVRGRQRLADNLRAADQDVRLYRLLTTLRQDVPLAEELADLAWQGVMRAPYVELCARLGFPELSTRPHRWCPDDGPVRPQ
jgi:5'-3' exonuclease